MFSVLPSRSPCDGFPWLICKAEAHFIPASTQLLFLEGLSPYLWHRIYPEIGLDVLGWGIYVNIRAAKLRKDIEMRGQITCGKETSFVGVVQLEPGEFVLLRALNTFFIILFIFRTFVCFWFVLFWWGSGIKVRFTFSTHHFQVLDDAKLYTQCGSV